MLRRGERMLGIRYNTIMTEKGVCHEKGESDLGIDRRSVRTYTVGGGGCFVWCELFG